VRHVAQIGAAIGRQFSYALLQAASRLHIHLPQIAGLGKARFNEKSGQCQVKIQIFSKLAA
jgi:hypothetical protein